MKNLWKIIGKGGKTMKIKGYFYKGLGTIIDVFLKIVISLVNFLVDIFSTIRHAIGLLISMGGCLFLVFIFNPYFLYGVILNPFLFTLIVLIVIVPFLGKISLSYLKYLHYVATEYFYDRSDYYLLGKNYGHKDFSSYSREYIDKLEKERLKREEERRKQEEEEWNRRFENFTGGFTWTTFDDFEDFFRNAQSGSYNYGNYGENQGNYRDNSYGPSMGLNFKKQYEDACDTLGVNYSADKYEVKLQYRKMAKKYHPDINKEEGATEKFQKINSAYEFLNDSNIERYKKLSGNN